MSLNGVLEGFVKGYKTGVEADSNRASAALDRERIRKSQPAPDQGTEGGPFGGSGATIGTGPGGTDSTTTGSVGGDTNQIASRLKADLMKDFKLSDVAAGGIVASLAAESGGFTKMQEINPTVKGSRGGYGYAQWTGPRRVEFEEYAKANNLDINSYEANYGNLKRELQGPEGAILKDLANAKDYHQATQIFTGSAKEGRGFLRPGDVNMSGRFAWADKVAGVKPFSGTQETGEAATDTAAAKPDPAVEEANKPTDASASSKVAIRGGFDTPTQTADASGYAIPEEELPEFGTMFARKGGVIPEPKRFADGGAAEPAFGGFGSLLSGATGSSDSTAKSGNGNSGDFGAGFGTGTYNADANPVSNWFSSDGTAPATVKNTGINAVTAAGQQANTATLASQQEAADAAAAKQQEDLYNALRDATQPVKDDDTTVTPPAANTGPTPSQQAFTNLQNSPSAYVAPVATPVPVAPAPKKVVYTPPVQHGLYNDNGPRPYMGGRNSRLQGGMVFAEGGAIPDPASPPVRKFAGGGLANYWQPRAAKKATNRDERFKQLLAIESRAGDSVHASSGSSARDRAARRLSAEEGRPSSTAYKPGKGGGKSPSGPKIPTKKVDRIKTGSTKPEISDPHINVTPGPKPEIADPHTNVKRGPTPEIADPHTNVKPTVSEIADPHTNVTPATKPGAIAEELADRDRKRPDRPGPVIPEPGTAPSPTSDPDQWKLPVGADPTIVRPGAIAEEEQGPPIPPKPVVPEPPDENAWLNPPGTTPVQTAPATPAPAVTPPVATPAPAATPAITPPVVPDKIDLRPAPAQPDTPAITPVVSGGVDHAALLKGAMAALAKGQDPQAIANLLRNAGISQELWPAELQNAVLGFARGGAIPEPGQPGYNEAVASGATAEREPMSPTPELRSHVAQALDGGIHMLKKVFNLGGEGAMPTPEDPAIQQQGAQRMASGEGAATEQEVQTIDQQIDPDNQLDDAGKEMTRLAKTTQWYLDQGRPEDAAASAMSLMQRSAQKFGKIGSLAQAAYNEYLQSHDPNDLAATTKYLEKAYQLIPDGANINISINPDTQTLQVARTNADGEEEMHEIKPNELPGLLKEAQNGSYYWGEIFKLADPKGYESKLTTERQVAEDARTDERWTRQHEITSKEELEKEERTAKRTAEEEKVKRAEKLEDEKRANLEADRRQLSAAGIAAAQADRAKQGTRTKEQIQADVGRTLGPAMTAFQAWKADKSPENKAALDEAASRAYEASGFDDTFMQNNGLGPGFEFQYVSPAEQPPVPGAQKGLDKEGKPIWWVMKDGKKQKVSVE